MGSIFYICSNDNERHYPTLDKLIRWGSDFMRSFKAGILRENYIIRKVR